MKNLVSGLLLLLLSVTATAADKNPAFQITGQVVDSEKQKGIPYVTITVKTDSARVLQKLCTSVNGKFSVGVPKAQKYLLEFTAVGFQPGMQPVQVAGDLTDMGTVVLKEGLALKEVAIVAQRPLVKVDADKIAYSVDSDPDAKTSNALEMLRKVPLLAVDGEDNVTLNGQTNFKVLVNGKTSSMMSKNFREVIKSLPANSIKDIEVITNPPSKYDSEGIGGIINIITFKKTINGYNGSVNAGIDTYGAANAGLYLSGKLNKFGYSGRYSINQSKYPPSTSSSYRESKTDAFPDRYIIRSDGKSDNGGFSQNFNGEASYDIDSLNLISMSFWGYLGNNRGNSAGVTEILSKAGAQTSYFEQNNTSKNTYGSMSGNIDYQKSYKKPDKSFTISYKLDHNPNTSSYLTGVGNTVNYDTYTQLSKDNQYTREQTLQVDYYDPLSEKHQYECGVKAIYRQNVSNSDYYRTDPLTGELLYSEERSNEMDYNQTIMGMYGGYVLKLKKFTFKSGLRAEFTWNDAESRSKTDTSFTSHLQNVVPYVTLSYKLKPTETIKLSYTQRLSRPGIWYLNPYRNQTSDLYVHYGNPDLKSEIANTFEAGYNFFAPKFNFSLTANTSFTNNSIEQIVFIDDHNVQNSTFDNIGTDFRSGLSSYVSYRPNSKFNISLNGGVNYVYYEGQSMGRSMKTEGVTYRIYLNSRVALWKDASVNGSMSYNSPYVSLQSKGSSYYYYSFGFNQYFLKRKMTLSMSLVNPFHRYRINEYEYISPDFYSKSINSREMRNLRVNVTYNFGKMQGGVKKARRGIQNDDMKGGGGGN